MQITLTDFILISLAAGRITQFLVWDSILDHVRARIVLWHAAKVDSKVRGFIVALIGCPLCLGFWVSGAVLALYVVATGAPVSGHLGTYGLLWWGVAMAQSLLNFLLDKLSS